MVTNECRCGRPTRDAAYVCDDCAHELNVALGETPWLEGELETTITRSKGVDYRTKGGTRSTEHASPVVWSAAEARIHLRAILVSWTKFCLEEHVRNQSPSQAMPKDTLAEMSRYLMWRVDGLALLDIGSDAVDEITSAVAHCRRLVDRPADRQYLGRCQECNEDGALYGRPGSALATCNVCGDTIDAEKLRAKLLGELDDRLCTASEIARLSTYLGLKADRDAVRKSVEHMGRKGLVTRHPAISDAAVYRFGEVYIALAKNETKRSA